MKQSTGIALCCCGCVLAAVALVGLYNTALGSRPMLLVVALAAGCLLAGLAIGSFLRKS